MPIPTTATFSVAAHTAASTAFRDLVDAGSGPGTVNVRGTSENNIGVITLTDPCGTIDGGGALQMTAAGASTALGTDTATYVQVMDSAGVVHLELPVEEGSAPVAGKAVLNTTTFVAGGAVQLISLIVG